MKINSKKHSCVFAGLTVRQRSLTTRNLLKEMLKQVQHDGVIRNALMLAVAVVTLSVQSCNYLNVDDYFEESLKYDSIFTTKRNIERYLWTTAAQFPDEGNFFTTLGSFASDEVFSVHPTDYAAMDYTLGNITPNSSTASGNRLKTWTTMYIIIRKANTLIVWRQWYGVR
jgi:hypothetical protein